AHIMIAAVFLHMCRVYFTGAYKKPRELNWLLGVVLMLVTIMFGYSGYLLPANNLSEGAANIGINMTRASPLIGDQLATLLFGDISTLTGVYILRWYWIHVFILLLLGPAEGRRRLSAVHHRGWHAPQDEFQRGVLGRHPERDPGHLPLDPAVHRPRSRGAAREGARAIRIRDRLPARVDLHGVPVFDPGSRRAAMADPERVPVDQRHRDEVVLHHPAGPGRPDVVHRPPPARIPADAEMARPVRRRADGDHGSAGRGNLLDPRLARTRGPTVRHRTRRVPPRPPRSDAGLECGRLRPSGVPRPEVDRPLGARRLPRLRGPRRILLVCRPAEPARVRLGPLRARAEHEHALALPDVRRPHRLPRRPPAVRFPTRSCSACWTARRTT